MTSLKPLRIATYITTQYIIPAHVINSVIYTTKENEVRHTFLAILRFVGKWSPTFTVVAFETHIRKHHKAPSTLDVLLSKTSLCVEGWHDHTWGPQRTVKNLFFLADFADVLPT